jgi:transcription elongation factor GreA
MDLLEKKAFYVTKDKLKDLEAEYEKLVDFERVKTVGQEAPKMLESEDMNPEFVAYQEDMERLRTRIDELKNILDNHVIIKKPPKEKQEIVDIGARVKVDLDGKHSEFTIVGTLEANPEEGRISNESPVGAALIGRKVGDEITLPHNNLRYKVRNISYEVS